MVSELCDSPGRKVMKSLSCEEVYERMDSGLCLFCDKLDTSGHHELKHKGIQIFMTVCDDDQVSEDKEDIHQEMVKNLDQYEETMTNPERFVEIMKNFGSSVEPLNCTSVLQESTEVKAKNIEHQVFDQIPLRITSKEKFQKDSARLMKSSNDVKPLFSEMILPTSGGEDIKGKHSTCLSWVDRVWEPGDVPDKLDHWDWPEKYHVHDDMSELNPKLLGTDLQRNTNEGMMNMYPQLDILELCYKVGINTWQKMGSCEYKIHMWLLGYHGIEVQDLESGQKRKIMQFQCLLSFDGEVVADMDDDIHVSLEKSSEFSYYNDLCPYPHGMCFSLPTHEGPFNERQGKVEITKKKTKRVNNKSMEDNKTHKGDKRLAAMSVYDKEHKLIGEKVGDPPKLLILYLDKIISWIISTAAYVIARRDKDAQEESFSNNPYLFLAPSQSKYSSGYVIMQLGESRKGKNSFFGDGKVILALTEEECAASEADEMLLELCRECWWNVAVSESNLCICGDVTKLELERLSLTNDTENERCLVPCPNYSELWFLCVDFVESIGGRELATFVKNASLVHLFSVRFKEHVDACPAFVALSQCGEERGFGFVENVTKTANMRKCLGNFEAAVTICKEALKKTLIGTESLETSSLWYVYFSRLKYMIANSIDEATQILIRGNEKFLTANYFLRSLSDYW